MAAADEARGARDPECEFLTRLLEQDGLPGRWLSPFDGQLAGQEVAALFTGTTSLQDGIDGNLWVPGAVACNLTSYGAVPANFHCSDDGLTCPANESQTSIARFVRAGATAAHGTAAEPLNNTFPNAGALLLYSAGYNLAESFLYSQRYLYWQNVLLGDPLVTPYATRPEVSVPAEAPQGGVLQIDARHPDGVASITLYLDGLLTQKTLGDQLSWPIEGTADDVLEVLAVARSAHATIQRQGWPVSEQTLRPRVQGWNASKVTIVDPIPTPPPTPADPVSSPTEPAEGCGCNTSGWGAVGWAWIPALLARRRLAPPRA